MRLFQSYLNILHDGRLAEAIAKHHLSLIASDSEPSRTEVVEIPEDTILSNLSISHKKAAMTLDTIDKFGPVKITVSTRFVDNMRTSRKRPRLFAKIKSTVMYIQPKYLSLADLLTPAKQGADSRRDVRPEWVDISEIRRRK